MLPILGALTKLPGLDILAKGAESVLGGGSKKESTDIE